VDPIDEAATIRGKLKRLQIEESRAYQAGDLALCNELQEKICDLSERKKELLRSSRPIT
jgi:hypothetical protein